MCAFAHPFFNAVISTLDKFELGIRKLIEDFMIERMGENDKIVTRCMGDRDFQAAAYPILAREIFDAVRLGRSITDEGISSDERS